jgi:hypothetical protein
MGGWKGMKEWVEREAGGYRVLVDRVGCNGNGRRVVVMIPFFYLDMATCRRMGMSIVWQF